MKKLILIIFAGLLIGCVKQEAKEETGPRTTWSLCWRNGYDHPYSVLETSADGSRILREMYIVEAKDITDNLRLPINDLDVDLIRGKNRARFL